MSKKTIQIVALILALAFVGTVVIYPLAFNPDEEEAAPETTLEVK